MSGELPASIEFKIGTSGAVNQVFNVPHPAIRHVQIEAFDYLLVPRRKLQGQNVQRENVELFRISGGRAGLDSTHYRLHVDDVVVE